MTEQPTPTPGAPAPVSGWCDPRFDAVRSAFAENFVSRGEVGASVCVIVQGEVVVDLVGGWTGEDRSARWTADTLVDVYSVGKALIALSLLRRLETADVDLDTPVAVLWPEFATGGKESATIRQALCHQAGVPAIRERLQDEDLSHWDRMTAALAATEAWWEPGTRHAYHTNTYGHLVGGILERAGGGRPGAALRAIAEPLGADVWFGVPDEHHHRCADVIWAPPRAMSVPDFAHLTGDAEMVALGYFNPPGYSSMGIVNTPAWRSAEVPSTNGHATAAGIARLYAALLRPGELLSPELLAEATRPQSQGFCPVLGEEVTFGLGFTPTSPRRSFGPNPGSFGHFGTGGALGFADPRAGVAFGYAMNHVIPRWQSTRNRALVEACYACLR